MGAEASSLRVVFDTNTVVSALVFGGRLGWLRQAWRERRIVPLVSRSTVDELIRVLAYPKFRLLPEEIELLIGDFLPHAEVVSTVAEPPCEVQCSDPADQKFMDLAVIGRADFLVSGDRHVLDLAPAVPFSIVTPAELRERLG